MPAVREGEAQRDVRARTAAAGLWAILWIAVGTVVLMTWHPWVIGASLGCPAGQRTGWDGHCRASIP
jgi:hypothetical protein